MWEALKDLLVAALEKAIHFHDNWKQQVDCRGKLCALPETSETQIMKHL